MPCFLQTVALCNDQSYSGVEQDSSALGLDGAMSREIRVLRSRTHQLLSTVGKSGLLTQVSSMFSIS